MVFSFNIFSSLSSRNQFLSAFVVNIISISHGVVLGWLSPYLPYLQSEHSPLSSGPVSVEESSWIGGFLSIGALFGNIVFMFISSKFGRKNATILLAFPQIGFWISVYFGSLPYHLYIARACAGITGGGIFVTLPIYIAEIAEPKIRGTLGSLLITSWSVGVLISFLSGAYFNYYLMPPLMISLPIIFAIGFYFFPESPQCFLRSNKINEAEQSLRFYRGFTINDLVTKEFNEEFTRMKSEINNTDVSINESKLQWRDFTTKQARKGLCIGVALMVLNQFSGCFAIMNYTANIFQEAGSNLQPNMAAIVVAVIQLIGSYISTILVDKSGRKILLIISSIGTSVGLATFGGYSYLGKNGYDVTSFGIVPIISMCFVVFIAYIGILTLPFVIVPEVLPTKIRSFGTSLCLTTQSILAFCTLKFFPVLVVTIELYGCMFIFSSVCIVGTLFVIFVIPETNGKVLGGADNEIIRNGSTKKN